MKTRKANLNTQFRGQNFTYFPDDPDQNEAKKNLFENPILPLQYDT